MLTVISVYLVVQYMLTVEDDFWTYASLSVYRVSGPAGCDGVMIHVIGRQVQVRQPQCYYIGNVACVRSTLYDMPLSNPTDRTILLVAEKLLRKLFTAPRVRWIFPPRKTRQKIFFGHCTVLAYSYWQSGSCTCGQVRTLYALRKG